MLYHDTIAERGRHLWIISTHAAVRQVKGRYGQAADFSMRIIACVTDQSDGITFRQTLPLHISWIDQQNHAGTFQTPQPVAKAVYCRVELVVRSHRYQMEPARGV